MNTRLLKKVRDKILENPTQVNMDHWYGWYNPSETEIKGCGTAGCICGWAVALQDKKTLAEENEAVKSKTPEMGYSTFAKLMEKLGREALGLTKSQANRLFYVETDGSAKWPIDLAEALDGSTNPESYAQVVADRIDRFIETKGKE